MGKMDEQIIVVPREKLFENETLTFQGSLVIQFDRIMDNMASHYQIMRRGDAENNPNFKQPIPYALIIRGDQLFMYKRLSGGGESRLYDKLSLGVGGHMNAVAKDSFTDILLDNLYRELKEELDIKYNDMDTSYIGLINDDSDEVGKVHIGILTLIKLDKEAEVTVKETDQLEGYWIDVKELKRNKEIYNKLENWSKIALDIMD